MTDLTPENGDDVTVTFSNAEARALLAAIGTVQLQSWLPGRLQTLGTAVRKLEVLTNDTWGEADCGHQH